MAARRYFDAAFGRYALASALATGTDFTLANALHGMNVVPYAATFMGCIGGGAVAFSLSRSWTFRSEDRLGLAQLGRFLLVWASSAVLNSGGILVLLPFVPSFPLAWLAVRASVYLAWNYPLARWFVFERRPGRQELSARSDS